MSIKNDMIRLLAQGVSLRDIVVNTDDDRWGCACAVQIATAQELVNQWRREGVDDGASIDDLQSGQEWLSAHLTESEAPR